MIRLVAILGVLAGIAGCAPSTECAVTYAPGVIAVDDRLLGKTEAELVEVLGRKPCMRAEDGLMWMLLGNTVMDCGMPTGGVLGLYMRDGKSIGYYAGSW